MHLKHGPGVPSAQVMVSQTPSGPPGVLHFSPWDVQAVEVDAPVEVAVGAGQAVIQAAKDETMIRRIRHRFARNDACVPREYVPTPVVGVTSPDRSLYSGVA